MIRYLAVPLVCVFAIQAGDAIAQTADNSSTLQTPPSVTKELPSNITGVFLYNNQPQPWQQMSQFLPVPPEFAVPGFLPHIPAEINFATEIKPWLGDWTANVLMPSSDGNPQEKLADRTVALAPVTDDRLLSRFIEQVKQLRSDPPREIEYQGVKILVWPEEVVPPSEIPPLPSAPSSPPKPLVPEGDRPPLPSAPPSPPPKPLVPEGDRPPMPSAPPRPSKPLLPPPTLDPQSHNGIQSHSGIHLSVGDLATSMSDSLKFHWKRLKSQRSQMANKTLVAQTFMETMMLSQSGADPEETVPELMPQVIPGLAIAVVPGYMAAARSSAPIEQWLRSRNQGTSLAESENFQRTLENPNFNQSLLIGYGQIGDLARSLFDEDFDRSVLPIPLPVPDSQELDNTVRQLEQIYSSGEVFVWFDPQGLRSQSRVYYQTPLSPSEIDPVSNTIYNQLPAATYFALSGQNLNTLVSGIFSGFFNQPEIAEVLSILGNTTDGTGLDRDQTMIPWLDGEYALFLFPTTGGLFPAFEDKLQVGIGTIVETSDRAAAMEALQRLDRWAVRSSQENIILKQDSLNGQPVTQWQVFNPQRQRMESLLSYSWLDSDRLIVTSGFDPLKELHPQPYLSLNQSFTFTTATNSLPSTNNGYFYINFGALLSLINNFLDPAKISNDSILILARNILGNIRSITLSTSTTPMNTQTDFFVVLSAPRRTP